MRLEALQDGRAQGLRLTFEDQGPGIPDIELALSDGYTTRQRHGARAQRLQAARERVRHLVRGRARARASRSRDGSERRGALGRHGSAAASCAWTSHARDGGPSASVSPWTTPARSARRGARRPRWPARAGLDETERGRARARRHRGGHQPRAPRARRRVLIAAAHARRAAAPAASRCSRVDDGPGHRRSRRAPRGRLLHRRHRRAGARRHPPHGRRVRPVLARRRRRGTALAGARVERAAGRATARPPAGPSRRVEVGAGRARAAPAGERACGDAWARARATTSRTLVAGGRRAGTRRRGGARRAERRRMRVVARAAPTARRRDAGAAVTSRCAPRAARPMAASRSHRAGRGDGALRRRRQHRRRAAIRPATHAAAGLSHERHRRATCMRKVQEFTLRLAGDACRHRCTRTASTRAGAWTRIPGCCPAPSGARSPAVL